MHPNDVFPQVRLTCDIQAVFGNAGRKHKHRRDRRKRVRALLETSVHDEPDDNNDVKASSSKAKRGSSTKKKHRGSQKKTTDRKGVSPPHGHDEKEGKSQSSEMPSLVSEFTYKSSKTVDMSSCNNMYSGLSPIKSTRVKKEPSKRNASACHRSIMPQVKRQRQLRQCRLGKPTRAT